MFEILRKIWRTGTVTTRQPLTAAAVKFRGKIAVDRAQCTCCQDCAGICPSGALRLSTVNGREVLTIDYGKCVFCGNCAQVCPVQALRITNQGYLAVKDKRQLVETGEGQDQVFR